MKTNVRDENDYIGENCERYEIDEKDEIERKQ